MHKWSKNISLPCIFITDVWKTECLNLSMIKEVTFTGQVFPPPPPPHFVVPCYFLKPLYLSLCTWTVYTPKQIPIQWESFLQPCVQNKHLLVSWWAHFKCECKSWKPLKYGCHSVKLYLFINNCNDGYDLTPNTHLSEDTREIVILLACSFPFSGEMVYYQSTGL